MTNSDRNLSHEEAIAAGLVTRYPTGGVITNLDLPRLYKRDSDWLVPTQFPGSKPAVPNAPTIIITEELRKQMDNLKDTYRPLTEAKPTKASDRQVAGTHYKDMGVQVWDVVDTWPVEQQIGYYRGGALKYLMRMGSKDQSAQEIAKGQHYMEKLLELLQSDVYKAS